jgi:DNA-directed RNA polymerase specialized sigma24 family protein
MVPRYLRNGSAYHERVPPTEAAEHLASFRARFLTYVRRRVSDPETAEDVVHASLLKAAESLGSLRSQDSLLPWF